MNCYKSHPFKKMLLHLIIFLMPVFLSGCVGRLSTVKEVGSYIEKNYGQNFKLLVYDAETSTGEEPYKVWQIELQEGSHTVTFELKNKLTDKLQLSWDFIA